MKTKYNQYAKALLLAILGMAVVACATIEGAGKDIESAGESIQDAADKN